MSMIRVSQDLKFTHFINNMNSSMSELMELNMQASSQKKVNAPSDDPVATGQIMKYRYQISSMEHYKDNADTGKGWLNTADNTLLQVSTLVTRARELAEQASTGTLSADNREQISYEARQLLSQLVVLSNTEFGGDHIFAGHKIEESAYDAGLMLQTSPDPNSDQYLDLDQWGEGVSGGPLSSTMTVKFVATGLSAGSTTNIGSTATAGLTARYSLDGGETWAESALSNATSFTLGGTTISLREGTPITLSDRSTMELNDDRTIEDLSGTTLHVMPTAYYNGDDNNQAAANITGTSSAYGVHPSATFEKDVHVENVQRITQNGQTYLTYDYTYADDPTDPSATWISSSNLIDPTEEPFIRLPEGDITISGAPSGTGAYSFTNLEFSVRADSYGVSQNMGTEVNAWADGDFNKNIAVRVDAPSSGGATSYTFETEQVNFSYSMDGGSSWVSGNTANNGVFTVPGGTMTLRDLAAADTINVGDQFVIHPNTADIEFEVSTNSTIKVNNVGKDIFGGMYEGTNAAAFGMDDTAKNLFNSLGRLVGYLEVNSQSGVQQALDELRVAEETVLVETASVGARENRLEMTVQVLDTQLLNKNERLSELEDVDVAELMTELTQQQIVYESVLKSSSMIMRMSLLNYL